MLTRGTRVRLLIFIMVSLLGIAYVGANYVGFHPFGTNGCTISADFPDSGGIFSNAEVTYRGVAVGKVGQLHLLKDGIRVDLALSDCDNPRIPASAAAAVTDRSAIGEQYVNLVPPDGNGPFVRTGTVLPMERNKIPTPNYVLVQNLDRLQKSINTDSLATTIDELGKAFSGRGPDLQNLIDAGDELLQAATEALPQTIDLIKQSGGVLQTQLDEGSAIASWAHSLNLLSAQLKASDPDIRHLLDTAPGDLQTIQSFIQDNRTDIGVVLAGLQTTNNITVRHIAGVEEILELYPVSVAGGNTVAPGDGTAHFGLVTITSPALCEQGYGGTVRRPPGNTAPEAPNTAAQCTLPRGNPSTVRGAQNAPGGDPVYVPRVPAYPSTGTSGTSGTAGTSGGADSGQPVLIGGNVSGGTVLGDSSWLPVLTAGLH
jgi:phospholipid/cholesterol/gamma-HCH transport system substrate-binding protein